jgi:thioredoxin reductase (NADPH)
VYDVEKKEVTGLKLRDVTNGNTYLYPTSAMFLGIGHIPNTKPFAGQLDMDEDGYLRTRDYVFTGVSGVFACGDVQDRRYRQAISAAGSGCMAAMEAEKFLEEHKE